VSAHHEHCESGHGCITCGDQAFELQVVAIDASRGLAVCVDEEGRRVEIDTLLVDPTLPGERLLVHAGVAIARLEAEEAA
jgi:hydrogenase maturation factor